VPVPQLVNYRYTFVQLLPKRSILHWNNIGYLHASMTNEEFLSVRQIFQSVIVM